MPADLHHESSEAFVPLLAAVGCATPIEADGMKVDRTADIAMVTCIDTEKSWKLTCKGNQWDGIAPSNCTKGKQNH